MTKTQSPHSQNKKKKHKSLKMKSNPHPIKSLPQKPILKIFNKMIIILNKSKDKIQIFNKNLHQIKKKFLFKNQIKSQIKKNSNPYKIIPNL